jgi:hypothetical protein
MNALMFLMNNTPIKSSKQSRIILSTSLYIARPLSIDISEKMKYFFLLFYDYSDGFL